MGLKEGPGRGKIALKGLRTHSWNVNNSPFRIRYISPAHTFLHLLYWIHLLAPATYVEHVLLLEEDPTKQYSQ